MRRRILLPALALAVSLVGCVSDDSAGPSEDAGAFDASVPFDAAPPFDANGGSDVGPDTTLPFDGGEDATSADDGGEDATSADDGGADAPIDAPIDAPVDAPIDAADAALTYAQTVLLDSPLSYWRFGESSGTTAVDQQSATNGTYNGTVTLGVAGAIVGDTDTAVTFDGATAYVDMGAGFAFGGTAAMSYEVWVNPNTGDGAARRFLSKETNDGAREGYLMAWTGTFMSWERWASGAVDGTGATLTAGTFHHVVVTYDGATMVFYLDGASAGTIASTRSIETITEPFRVATYSAFLSASDCFGGTLDEVAIYDHALSSASVAAHYHVGSGQ